MSAMATIKGMDMGEDLSFHYAGREDCSPGHGWSSLRDHFLFHYVFSGKGKARFGETEVELGPGSGFLFFPGELSSYRADAQEPWSYAWLAFSGAKAAEALAELGLDHERRIYRTECQAELTPRLLASVTALAESCGRLRRLSLLYAALADLAEHAAAATDAAGRATTESYVDEVLDFIQRNYSRHNMSIETMADKIGLSRKYLSQLVRERMGKTPMALLMECRMYAAQGLLTTTDMPISNVAASVGYGDQLAFSKAFRQWAGMSPSDYRKKMTDR